MSNLPRIVIKKARRRFGNRKQWKATPFSANNAKLDFNDTYANVADVRKMLDLLRGPVELEIHYDTGVHRETLQ